MAAGILPRPGTEYGPCEQPPGGFLDDRLATCGHRDCAATRRDAATICHLCGKPIGYDVRFYSLLVTNRTLTHATCEENADEAERFEGPRPLTRTDPD